MRSLRLQERLDQLLPLEQPVWTEEMGQLCDAKHSLEVPPQWMGLQELCQELQAQGLQVQE